MPTSLHFYYLCCLTRDQHKLYFHLLDTDLLYLVRFVCHDNIHFFLVNIGIVLHFLTSPYKLQLPCLIDHSQCTALLEFHGIQMSFVRCVISAVLLHKLLNDVADHLTIYVQTFLMFQ